MSRGLKTWSIEIDHDQVLLERLGARETLAARAEDAAVAVEDELSAAHHVYERDQRHTVHGPRREHAIARDADRPRDLPVVRDGGGVVEVPGPLGEPDDGGDAARRADHLVERRHVLVDELGRKRRSGRVAGQDELGKGDDLRPSARARSRNSSTSPAFRAGP